MHADVIGDIAQHQRTQVLDALVEKLALERDDAGRDLHDRALPLVDTLQQPQRRSELVFDVGLGLVRCVAGLVEQAPIHRADAQLRQAVFVERGLVTLVGFDDVDVGDDVLRVGRRIARARFRVEVPDDLEVLLHFLGLEAGQFREFRNAMVLQQAHVIAHEHFRRRARQPEVLQLEEQTLLQVPRANADRIKPLNMRKGALDVGHLPGPKGRDFFERRDQDAVFVDVADDRFADFAQQVVGGLQAELPLQVIGERAARRERVFDWGKFTDFNGGLGAPVPVFQILAEEILIVSVVPGVAFFVLLRFGLGLGGFGGGGFRGRRFVHRLLFEHRVFDHFLVQELGQLQRRHRQQLDGLLE